MLQLLLIGCLSEGAKETESNQPSQPDSPEDTAEPTDTNEPSEPANEPSEPGNEPSEPSDEPEALIVAEGTYTFSNIQEVSDVCGVGNWAPEPVTSFVPADMAVSNSSEGQFTIDGNAICTRSGTDGLTFDCQTQSFMEVSDSVLGEVTLEIENRLSGQIVDDRTLDARFDVTLIECTNNFAACGAMSLALGGFPCLIELDTTASQ